MQILFAKSIVEEFSKAYMLLYTKTIRDLTENPVVHHAASYVSLID